MCASACVLVLAGGVERLVGPCAAGRRASDHHAGERDRRLGASHLDPEDLRAGGRRRGGHPTYLAAMGVGDPVMALMRKTPAASIRWLSLADLRASGLATRALDAAEPIATSGANGLNAPGVRRRAADADSCRRASPSRSADRAPALDVAFRYRRGGGAVEAEATPRDSGSRLAADPPAVGWSLTLNASRGRTAAIDHGLDGAGRAPSSRANASARSRAAAASSPSRAEASRRTRRRENRRRRSRLPQWTGRRR